MPRAEEIAKKKLLDNVEDVTHNYRLVADYYRRPLAVDDLNENVKSMNAKTAVRI